MTSTQIDPFSHILAQAAGELLLLEASQEPAPDGSANAAEEAGAEMGQPPEVKSLACQEYVREWGLVSSHTYFYPMHA